MNRRRLLLEYYEAMSSALGPSHWWPGQTDFEVMVGAVLTQNTNWGNVEKAIANLRGADVLTPAALAALPSDVLSEFIRPAGYFRLKADRLRNLLAYLEASCGYDLDALKRRGMDEVREGLLSVRGVGPETADSILLYALGHPTFVVDAYTARLFKRHGLVPEEVEYEELRSFFMDSLSEGDRERDVPLFNEYHALIVRVGKDWCRKRDPLCEKGCPLCGLLEGAA